MKKKKIQNTLLWRFSENIISSGRHEDFDQNVINKVIVLNTVSIIGISMLTIFGTFAFYQSIYMLAVADYTVAFILILIMIYLRKSGRYDIASTVGTSFAGLFFLYLFISGGAFNTGPLWFYTFPLFAAFLLGSKRGALITLLLIIASITSLFFRDVSPLFTTYPRDFILRFIPSLLVVFAYSYLYERRTEKVQKKLIINNLELDRKVRERTAELGSTNKELQQKILEQEMAEEALKSGHERFTTVLNSIDADIYVADMDTYKILFMNKHMKEAFGIDHEEQTCWKLTRGLSGPCENCTNDKVLDDKGHPAGVYIWEDQNQVTGKWYINYDRAIKWVDGRYVRIRVATDVTQLKQTEAALQKVKTDLEDRVAERTKALSLINEELLKEIAEHRQTETELKEAKLAADKANQAKSGFLANMSHELRTPLNHIIGFTEMVVDNKFGELNEKQNKYLTNVLQSGQHLLSLINDILDLSKVEAGKLDLEISDVNLKTLLQNSLTMIKEKALKHNLDVSLNLDGIPKIIRGDERKLKQIVYNLLSNAVKFTPDSGKIGLSAQKVTRYDLQMQGWALATAPNLSPDVENFIKITVSDTGIGIKPEDLIRIFKPFEQVESAASRKYEGTGLGLSLTKILVELHGGLIWPESEGEYKGSKFSFAIPV
jgi:signal transduction histidine kinase